MHIICCPAPLLAYPSSIVLMDTSPHCSLPWNVRWGFHLPSHWFDGAAELGFRLDRLSSALSRNTREQQTDALPQHPLTKSARSCGCPSMTFLSTSSHVSWHLNLLVHSLYPKLLIRLLWDSNFPPPPPRFIDRGH